MEKSGIGVQNLKIEEFPSFLFQRSYLQNKRNSLSSLPFLDGSLTSGKKRICFQGPVWSFHRYIFEYIA